MENLFFKILSIISDFFCFYTSVCFTMYFDSISWNIDNILEKVTTKIMIQSSDLKFDFEKADKERFCNIIGLKSFRFGLNLRGVVL